MPRQLELLIRRAVALADDPREHRLALIDFDGVDPHPAQLEVVDALGGWHPNTEGEPGHLFGRVEPRRIIAHAGCEQGARIVFGGADEPPFWKREPHHALAGESFRAVRDFFQREVIGLAAGAPKTDLPGERDARPYADFLGELRDGDRGRDANAEQLCPTRRAPAQRVAHRVQQLFVLDEQPQPQALIDGALDHVEAHRIRLTAREHRCGDIGLCARHVIHALQAVQDAGEPLLLAVGEPPFAEHLELHGKHGDFVAGFEVD